MHLGLFMQFIWIKLEKRKNKQTGSHQLIKLLNCILHLYGFNMNSFPENHQISLL
ncbi:hypothetical protein ACJIZ3_000760 [Penstemon smallii]|uniref:Uncharacterized protein n=1 Tax=Penstemon smallii TaxID=265156 RepID=A0ABD3U2S2_9LAMI